MLIEYIHVRYSAAKVKGTVFMFHLWIDMFSLIVGSGVGCSSLESLTWKRHIENQKV